MPRPAFSPGFRFSTLDGIVLALGVPAAIGLGTVEGWLGFAAGFSLGHFFLFCNVFRLARSLELVWSAVFVGLCSATMALGTPGWYWTVAISVAVTLLVVVLEMRKPSYHGIGWERINPGLRAWWESRSAG